MKKALLNSLEPGRDDTKESIFHGFPILDKKQLKDKINTTIENTKDGLLQLIKDCWFCWELRMGSKK